MYILQIMTFYFMQDIYIFSEFECLHIYSPNIFENNNRNAV